MATHTILGGKLHVYKRQNSRFAGHASVQLIMERYGHLLPTPDHQRAMAVFERGVFG